MLNFILVTLLIALVRAEDLLGQCLCPDQHVGQLVSLASDTRDGYIDGCECYIPPSNTSEQTSTIEPESTEEVTASPSYEETNPIVDVTVSEDIKDDEEITSSPITEDLESDVSVNPDLTVNEEGSTASPTVEDTIENTVTSTSETWDVNTSQWVVNSTTEAVDINTSQEEKNITSDGETKDVTSVSLNSTSVNIETNDDDSTNNGSLNTVEETTGVEILNNGSLNTVVETTGVEILNNGSLNTVEETTGVEILNNGSLVSVEETKNNDTVIVVENNDGNTVEGQTSAVESNVTGDIKPVNETEDTTPGTDTVVQTPPSAGEVTLDGGCNLPWNTSQEVADGWIGKDEKDCNTCSCANGNLACSMLVCIGCTLSNGENVDHGWKGKDGCKDCACLNWILKCSDSGCIEENNQTTGEVENPNADEGENEVTNVEEVEEEQAGNGDAKDDTNSCDCGGGKTGTHLRFEEDLHDGKQDGCWCPLEDSCDCTGFSYDPVCSTAGKTHFNLCAIQCAHETPHCNGECPCIVTPPHDIYSLPSPCDCGEGVTGFYEKEEGSTTETCICPNAVAEKEEEVEENKGEDDNKEEDKVEEEEKNEVTTDNNEVNSDEEEEEPALDVKEPNTGEIFGPCDCGDGITGVIGGFDADTWDGKQDGCYCSRACDCPDGTVGKTGNPAEDTKDGAQDGCICPAHHCPVEEPLRYGTCDGILTCGYKKECCCGKCYNALMYECVENHWSEYFSEACHNPECTPEGVTCDCPGGIKGVRANVDLDTRDDHKNGCLCPKVVSESTPTSRPSQPTQSPTELSSDVTFGSPCDCPDGSKGTRGNFVDDTQDGDQDGCFCHHEEHHIFGGPCHCPGGGKGHKGNYLTDTEDGHQDGCICTPVTEAPGNGTTDNHVSVFGGPCHCHGGTTGVLGNIAEDTSDGIQDGCFCSPSTTGTTTTATTTDPNTASSSSEDVGVHEQNSHVCTCPDGIDGIKASTLMDTFDGTVDGCLCHEGRTCHCLGGSHHGIVEKDKEGRTSCFCVGPSIEVGVSSMADASGGGLGTIAQFLLFALAVAFMVVIGYYFYKRRQGPKYTQVAEETEMATSEYVPPTGGYSVVDQDVMQLR